METEQALAVGVQHDGQHDEVGQVQDQDGEPRVPAEFHVHDSDSANWLIRKIVEARAHALRVKVWAEQEVRRTEQVERFFLWKYGPQLQAWVRAEIERNGGRRRSVSLPDGRAGFRTVGPTLVIENAKTVLIWAKRECPAAVATTERLLKTPLDEHIERTGELPTGTSLQVAQDRFFIGENS